VLEGGDDGGDERSAPDAHVERSGGAGRNGVERAPA
jgi:hypothetical protein